MAKGKVDFPVTPEEKVAFLELFSEKHNALGEQSPLRHLVDYNADNLAVAATAILDHHKKAEEMTRRAKAHYSSRNTEVDVIEPQLRRAITFLRALYGNDQHALSEWGIDLIFGSTTTAAAAGGSGGQLYQPHKFARVF